ncbi:regulatory protein RecX [Sanguibacter inulinus]|uniref:Regulatory protein RecX n=1 Tax=Sanguibacter inulinus TaxID=60922 RepID=A0A853EUX9_9MICO|nr:regulatory protein RecX [Sanguibacter inulinus]NYS94405.1 regulatory protein RecX [Sanguibacter inulinus]
MSRSTGSQRPQTAPGEEERAAVSALSHAEKIESARNRALKILTATAKSRHQLEERLLKAGEEPEIVTELLDRLENVGLLDDAQLAAMIVRTRFSERGQTRRAIAQELRRKGIDGEVAEEALAQVDDADEAGAAVEVARKKLRQTASLDRPVRIRRALGALGRKGYSSGVAMQAIQSVLAEEPAIPDDGGSTEDDLGDTGPGDDWI